MLAWDTETDLIKPGLLAPPMACLSLAEYVGENPVGRVVHVNDSEQECERILSEPSTAANAPYDLAVVGVRFPRLMPLVFEALAADRIYDVQMRQKLLDIATGKYRRVFRKINGKIATASSLTSPSSSGPRGRSPTRATMRWLPWASTYARTPRPRRSSSSGVSPRCWPTRRRNFGDTGRSTWLRAGGSEPAPTPFTSWPTACARTGKPLRTG